MVDGPKLGNLGSISDLTLNCNMILGTQGFNTHHCVSPVPLRGSD